MEVPDKLYYTEDHEWASVDDGLARIGITDYAQHELGDIVYVELSPAGTSIAKGDPIGTVESVKAVSDVISPVSGVVAETNEELLDAPEKLNGDPYGAWIAKIQDVTATEELMDAEAYEAFTREA